LKLDLSDLNKKNNYQFYIIKRYYLSHQRGVV
jgi:hypothetical protein